MVSKLNAIISKLVSKKVLVIVAVLIYMLALVAYEIFCYERDMFSIVTGYIGAVIMIAIVFTVFFLVFRSVKELGDIKVVIVCIEFILTIITGISFITGGFLVLSFMVPTAFMATICGMKNE